MRRYALRDDQWERIRGLLPGREGRVGVTAADNRLFVEAVLYRYRAGIPWRDLPGRFGDWKNAHRRHSRWSKSGVGENVFKHLAADADNEYAMIDSTIVRAHQHSAGAQKSRTPGDRTLPRRAEHQDPHHGRCLGRSMPWAVDALGNPVGFVLTGGQAHDLVGADHLLPGMDADTLIADKAFDADKRVVVPLAEAGKTAVIPSKASRKVARNHDPDLYKARHLIENFFAKLKQFRAIATRYDKTARNFLGAIHLAATSIWLN